MNRYTDVDEPLVTATATVTVGGADERKNEFEEESVRDEIRVRA